LHGPRGIPLAREPPTDGQWQDRPQRTRRARRGTHRGPAGARDAEYADGAVARHGVGDCARHPRGTDRETGSLLRPRRHVIVRFAAPDRPGPRAVLQTARGPSKPCRSGNADRWSPCASRSGGSMTVPAAVSTLHAGLEPGKPPLLRVESGVDAARWAAEHREGIRAFVAEQGSLLVRGLGLRVADQAEAVFRQLGHLALETEAFAPREIGRAHV